MILRIILGLLAAVVLYFGAVMVASEIGGEVVVLTTLDGEGAEHVTSLWVVEDEGAQWLRAGMPDSGWYQRLSKQPEVVVERDGRRLEMVAIAVPAKRDRVHSLMRERYGWADAFVGSIPGRDPTKSVAIRLDPR